MKVILLDAPFAGLEFLVTQVNGRSGLSLDAGQQKYDFETAPANARP